jgi:hypothetical protein
MSDDVVVLKREELIKFLVESYMAGIETAQHVINSIKLDPEEIMQKFEEGIVSKINHTAN